MSDNKKYYYLKLKENFFDSEEIKLLEAAENGYLYSNILLKMYLKSLKTEGRLMFRENIPYNEKMLAVITGHNVDIIKQAISVFIEIGLVQQLDSGAIYMADIQSYIGESSTEADRKREYRLKIDSEKQNGTNVRTFVGRSSPEIEIERDIELEKEKTIMSGKPDETKISYNNLEIIKPSFAEDDEGFPFDDYEHLRDIVPPKNGKFLEIMAMVVLKHFNWITKSKFRPVQANLTMIKACLATGATLGSCYAVNAFKSMQWANDENMAKYIRIKTFYAPKNFEQYLGEIKTNNYKRSLGNKNE